MRQPILTVLICVLTAQPSFAMKASLLTEARNQQRLTRAENLGINCRYPELIATEITEAVRLRNFAPPTREACSWAQSEYSSLETYFAQRPKPVTAFPLYSDVFAQVKAPLATKLQAKNLAFPLHSPAKRLSMNEVRVDAWQAENRLRTHLGVQISAKGSLPPAGNCRTDIAQDIAILKNRPYDFVAWHALLLEKGYDCTAATFMEVNKLFNRERNYGAIQENFAKNIQDFTRQEFKSLKTVVEDRAILYFPPLGYDIPNAPFEKEREHLTPGEIKKAFGKLGARVYVIERVTTGHRDVQIEESWQQVKKIIEREAKKQKTGNPKFLLFARSMGGMIAREVMSRHPELENNISSAFFLGSTPWGSVIADYKFRADLFDDTYMQLNDRLFKTIGTVGGFFNKKLKRFQTASGLRLNYWTMSHLAFSPRLSSLRIPVLNVVTLPASVRNYYNGSTRIAGVDYTFLHMSMYGPTEGSSPLASAAWDTQRSARVVDARLNHLAFWELTDKEALALWAASVYTAHQAGMFR